ncbi:MAG: glycoside hydrolase family 65 protein [Candidatus Bipolaricaulota bacterium]|nr:MAG: glycoside hydrolase family 65 protein [Candidatus Bipolaricaulota bacterium]
MSDSPWLLTYRGFDPEEEPLRETLCALGNGRFVTRGASEEAAAGGPHYPATYLAGGYNRLVSRVSDRDIVNEDLVNFPDWTVLGFRFDEGAWFAPSDAALLDYEQTLDLRHGVLSRIVRLRDDAGRIVRLRSRRVVHMAEPGLAAIEYRILLEEGAGRIEIRSGLDGTVINAGVARYRELSSKHLEVLEAVACDGEMLSLHVRTVQSRLEMAQVARTRLWRDGKTLAPTPKTVSGRESVEQRWQADLAAGEEIVVEKVVAVRTSRDRAASNVLEDARLEAGRAGRFAELLATHAAAWERLWRRFDIEVETDEEVAFDGVPLQRVLRLHAFHLLQTACENTVGLDVSVPARGLHGEAYRGHIFWDEMYILPFYILRAPEIARSLLLYRYHRLPEARAYAREEGYRGAMIPWQTGSSGREETQRIHLNPRSGTWDPDLSRRQRHVGAACAVNVWRYWQATGDRDFLERYGARMLTEIARFWASAAVRDETSGRYDIPGVMGPDEFHEKYPGEEEEGLRSNAYTNVMAAWCLTTAARALEELSEGARGDLTRSLDLSPEEIDAWCDVAERLSLATDEEGRLLAFRGYDRLLELDWDAYREKYGNIGRLDRILKAEGDSPDRYKLSKQADLCMLFYVLDPDELRPLLDPLGVAMDAERARATIEYYRRRTSHGSTLSHVVFASILHRLDPPAAWAHFLDALASDLCDTQGGTTPEGIHAAVMAATLGIVLSDYAGVRLREGGLHITPDLPPAVRCIRFPLVYRGARLRVSVDRDRIAVELDAQSSVPVPLIVNGDRSLVAPGASLTLELSSA